MYEFFTSEISSRKKNAKKNPQAVCSNMGCGSSLPVNVITNASKGKSNLNHSDDHSYDIAMSKRIAEIFQHYVKPTSVLHVFQKYNSKVLTEIEKEQIRCKVNTEGEIQGSIFLLEHLCLYENWFDCLIKVLEDDEVKLSHIVPKFLDAKEKLDKELFASEKRLKMEKYHNKPKNEPIFGVINEDENESEQNSDTNQMHKTKKQYKKSTIKWVICSEVIIIEGSEQRLVRAQKTILKNLAN